MLGLAAMALGAALMLSPLFVRGETGGDKAEANAAKETEKTPTTRPAPGGVAVARFVYKGNASNVCFSGGFLATVDRKTDTSVERAFRHVDLTTEDVFQYPFAVFTGDRSFELDDAEKKQLRAYLTRGGFLLASASCSNHEWAENFRALMAELFPKSALKPLTTKHAVFHQLYDIDSIAAKHRAFDTNIYGLTLGDRLAVVFSPLGLNDTANAGDGCCCCGGNEIRDAELINANVLIYALTH